MRMLWLVIMTVVLFAGGCVYYKSEPGSDKKEQISAEEYRAYKQGR